MVLESNRNWCGNDLPSQLDVTDEFGYWFSGFFDGEGSLIAVREKSKTRKKPQRAFKIQILLREDDKAVNHWILKNLGCGRVYRHPIPRNSKVNAQPGSLFRVSRFQDLVEVIIPLLDKYPLHTKKLGEYRRWRELLVMRYRQTACGKDMHHPYPDEYCALFDELAKELRSARQYKAPRSAT